jgi:UDP-N-acetyl-D-glucosamine dehydrogenase
MGAVKKSVGLGSDEYDLIIITVAHTNIDYELVAATKIPVLDTKNAMKYVATRYNIELL